VERRFCVSTQSQVHPTSIIEDGVVLGENVDIGPFCHITGDVTIGEGTTISSFNYIEGPAKIGKDNFIGPNCVIGTPAEHKNADSVGEIIIGDGNTIRELTVIQRGTGERDTQIGNRCFIMDHVHIAHDVLVANDVTVAPNVVFGGHSVVLDGATIGIGSSTHQFSTIGAYSMIGMNSTVTRDVPPFYLVSGTPANFMRWNSFQLNLQEFSDPPEGTQIKEHTDLFEQFSKRKVVIRPTENVRGE